MKIRFLFAIVFISLVITGVRGHDLWLIPPERANINQRVILYANVGMDFPHSVHALDPKTFVKRIVMGRDGKTLPLDTLGIERKSGRLGFTPKEAGIYIAGVETAPKIVRLEAGDFNQYLVHDGLPQVYLQRVEDKTLNEAAVERYTKFPKAIVNVGGGKGDPCRELGLALEIIPERDPLHLTIGETLWVKVLFQGKPLPDAMVGWNLSDDGKLPRGTTRTDAKGRALIPIGRIGLMTLRLTHLTRPKTKDYEWESFWATLTFRIEKR